MPNPKIALVSGDLDEPLGQDAAVDTGGSYRDGTTKFLTQSGTWSSSATSVATVSAGLVTNVNYGMTTITASYGGPTATPTLTDFGEQTAQTICKLAKSWYTTHISE